MTKTEFKQWQMLVKQYKNGYHLSVTDKQDLLRLNHRVMEIADNIHNANMMGNL